MCNVRFLARWAGTCAAVAALAASFLVLAVDTAEARRFRIRFHSGSSSASSSGQAHEDGKLRPRTPAAAAERARRALDREKATIAPPPALDPKPAAGAKTTGYSNGVTCIAGC